MAPGRRRGGAEPGRGGGEAGGGGEGPKDPTAARPELGGEPPVSPAARSREPWTGGPARQVIVRPGAKGVWKIAADPCVLARRPPAKRRSWGARQRWLGVRRSRGARSHAASFPGSGFWAAPGLSVLAQPLLSKRHPGAVLLSAARRAGPGCGTGLGTPTTRRPREGWPTVTGGGGGCEVSRCGRSRALRGTPLRRDGEPGRSWGREQRRGRRGGRGGGGVPRGRGGEVTAAGLTSHQTVNLEKGVC